MASGLNGAWRTWGRSKSWRGFAGSRLWREFVQFNSSTGALNTVDLFNTGWLLDGIAVSP
jgi:hypothetical protein